MGGGEVYPAFKPSFRLLFNSKNHAREPLVSVQTFVLLLHTGTLIDSAADLSTKASLNVSRGASELEERCACG